MKHVFRGLAAGAAGLLLTAGLAGPAAADHTTLPADAALTVTPTAAPEDADITVTGTGCDSSEVEVATVTLESVTDAEVLDEDDAVTVEDDGTFSTVLTVPAGTDPEDEYRIEAVCGHSSYPPVAFDVTGIRDGGTLAASPTSGDAGTQVTISGTGCDEEAAEIFLGSSDGGSGGPIESTRKAVEVADDGTFSGTVTVPQGSNPDRTYTAQAECGGELYEGVRFDVTGPTGGNGYRMVAADGGIFTFGARTFHGSTGDIRLNQPIVGGATDTSDYDGYWIVARDGGVFTFNAEFHGSLAGQTLSAPAVEIEPTPSGRGYWIVLADGKVFAFGDAKYFGDMSGRGLNRPVIGMAVTPTGQGYWLVAEDGGIFNFGDAGFFGSMGDRRLNAPIIDLAPSVDNNGYYLLGRDGGVFTFGSADFKGSTGDIRLNAPVVAMLVAPNGAGYWLAATDGGVFTFGAVEFLGSTGNIKLNSPVLDLIN